MITEREAGSEEETVYHLLRRFDSEGTSRLLEKERASLESAFDSCYRVGRARRVLATLCSQLLAWLVEV
jgi:hypothetical protein